MKLAKKYFAMLLALLMVSAITVSCGDDDEPTPEPTPTPEEDVLKVGSNELLFSSNATNAQSVTITCNREWTASVDASWIDISPKSGEGNGSINISVNSVNETSKDRVAVVSVVSGELKREITVTHKASLVADCVVNPINLVILSNQLAFDAEWGKQAAYFQFKVIKEKDAKRMTDAEVISSMAEDERYVEQDEYFYMCTRVDGEALEPLSEYIIFTLAHDEKGNRGDLIKTKVSTPSDRNQPLAEVTITNWDGAQWHWTTTKNGYCNEYYQASWSGDLDQSFLLVPNVVYAYFIQQDIRRYPNDYPPAISDGRWVVTPYRTPYITVASWAKGKDGVWSGVVDYDFDCIDWYSSSTNNRKVAKKTPAKSLRNGAVNKNDFKNLKIVRCR